MLKLLSCIPCTRRRRNKHAKADREALELIRKTAPAMAYDFPPNDETYDVRLKDMPESTEGRVSIFRSQAKRRLLVVKDVKRKMVMKPDGTGIEFDFPNEAKMLLQVLAPHDNIIGMFAARRAQDPLRCWMYMEYCAGGDLCDQFIRFRGLSHWHYEDEGYPVLKRSEKRCYVPEILLVHVFIDLVDALAYIHHGLRRNKRDGTYTADPEHQSIIHADIKLDNVFLRWPARTSPQRFGLPDIVLADFGLSMLEAESRGIEGTASYVAPEVHAWMNVGEKLAAEGQQLKIMTTASDIYSLGVLMHFLATWEWWPCFTESSSVRLPQVYGRTTEWLLALETVLAMCLEIDPVKRPEAVWGETRGLLRYTECLRSDRERLFEEHGWLPLRVWRYRPWLSHAPAGDEDFVYRTLVAEEQGEVRKVFPEDSVPPESGLANGSDVSAHEHVEDGYEQGMPLDSAGSSWSRDDEDLHKDSVVSSATHSPPESVPV